MGQLAASIVGRIRLARSRCPACASEGSRHAVCDTCMGYQGPFPVSEATRRRWAWRFEHRSAARAAGAAVPLRQISFPIATHPLR